MTSGIDTESIISKLVAVERRPQDLMKARVATLQRAQSAWSAISNQLTALKTAADALSGLDAAATMRSATSTNPSAISVRATDGGVTDLSSSVQVTNLAAAKAVLVGDVFTAATDSVGARTLSITAASGATTNVVSTDGTLAGLAAAVNGAGLGVSARVLQTAAGSYQLSLTATSTGVASSFTATGTGWTGFTTVREAADASLVIDGVNVSRSSNTINDILDGVELTLQATTTTPVTVASTRDKAAITSKVKGFVDAANALMATVSTATKTSTDEASRGPLAGDYTVRRIADSIRDAIAQPLTNAAGVSTTASALGVSLNRDGTLSFDADALAASLASDAGTVLSVIGRNANSTAAGVTVTAATSSATASTRAITVTQSASQATLVGLVTPPPPPGSQVSMIIVTPGGSYTVNFLTGTTVAETAGNLNAALRAAGVGLLAVAQPGGSIDLKAERFGSGQAFTVTGGDALGLAGAATDGVDAAGTIDGTAFTAIGKFLSTGGLVLSIGTTATQLANAGGTVSGSVSLTSGLAGALSAIGAQGGAAGLAPGSKASLQDQIDDLQKRINRYDDLLKNREMVLRAKYTAMETMIDKLQSSLTPLGSLGSTS